MYSVWKQNSGPCTVQKLDTLDARVSVALLRNCSTSHLRFLALCNTRVCSERKYWSVIRIGMGFLKPEVTTIYCRTRIVRQFTNKLLGLILYFIFCITFTLNFYLFYLFKNISEFDLIYITSYLSIYTV